MNADANGVNGPNADNIRKGNQLCNPERTAIPERARHLQPVPLRTPESFPLLTEGKLGNGYRFSGAKAAIGALDTVGISFPIRSSFETRGATATVANLGMRGVDGEPLEMTTYRHKLPGGGFVSFGKGDVAWFEASLPKRVDGNNVEALGLCSALEVLRDGYEETQTLCEVKPDHLFEHSKVIRLDPVRDFDGVSHIGPLLDGLAAVRRDDRRWKVRRHQDGERNMAETVRVGPRAWGGTLYDKFAETEGLAAAGRLRFEMRLHGEQLTSAFAVQRCGGAIARVADLSEEKLCLVTREWFQRCAFDREVSGMASVAERIRDRGDLDAGEVARFWAYLTMPGFSSSLSDKTERKYRRLARSMGLAPGAIESVDATFVVRLDFDQATEVVRRAA